jgi:DNA repair exonuclease SbcCD ATPase subunit
MKFLNLRICNFLTIGDSGDLSLSDKGLVLIQGFNADDTSAVSNGAGKSSIPDALCWALYGETARGESGDSVVNNKAKKNCMVRVTLQDGESIYEITRYRKHKDFKNSARVFMWNPASGYPASVGVDISRATEKDTQLQIDEIMGCRGDVFSAAIYAGQEKMPDLPRLTDKQLKMLIEQAAGVERLERAYTIAKDKEASVAREHAAEVSKLNGFNLRIEGAKATFHTQGEAFKAFENQRPTLQVHHRHEAGMVAASMKAAHTALLAIGEAPLKTELDGYQAQLSQHSASVVACNAGRAAKNAADMAVNTAQHEQGAVVKVITGLKAQLGALADSVGKPCPECGKPMTQAEIEESVNRLNEKMGAEKANLIAVIEKVRVKQEEAAVAASKIAELEAAIPDVSVISARIAEINAALLKANQYRSQLLLLKKDYDKFNAAADEALKAPNPHQSGVEVAAKQIREIEADIAATGVKITALEAALGVATAVSQVFSPAGVRAHILDTVTPFLNERTAEYLNALSDGNMSAIWSTLSTTKAGELREKFNIEVDNGKGGSSFGLISGGEKRKVRLACMLALQDLVSARATKSIDLWIGDEIDDAMDSAGLERLMTILECKARERGTVLVISHNELRDWVDQTVTVTKEGGVSRIEGFLSAA